MRPNSEDIKTCIVMVGLPARGKSYTAHRLNRYLKWLGYRCKLFNLGNYRRSCLKGEDYTHDFFSFKNEKNRELRNNIAKLALEDMTKFYDTNDIAILDATNVTLGRRKMVTEKMVAAGTRVLFVEVICNKQEIVNETIINIKCKNVDYANVANREEAVMDFKNRIRHYEEVYVPVGSDLSESHLSYIKTIDLGSRFVINNLQDFLQNRIANFLMTQKNQRKTIFLTRHGESEFNLSGKIGGNSRMTASGHSFSQRLATFLSQDDGKFPAVYTSPSTRTIETAQHLGVGFSCLSCLKEINAGVCENLTYQEITQLYPNISTERSRDKFNFVYPVGESYRDVCNRVEPFLLQLELEAGNVLVISHYAVLRVILAYYLDLPQDRTPYLDIPLHQLVKLEPSGLEYHVSFYDLSQDDDVLASQPIATTSRFQ